MPRTTIELDSSVLAELRRRAAEERKSIGRLASELLAHELVLTRAAPNQVPLDWISRDLGTPRVDLEDKEAVEAALHDGS